MRDTAVLVFVTTTLSDVLAHGFRILELALQKSPVYCKHTDLTTGPFAMTVVLKLNGPAAVESVEPFCTAGAVSVGLELRANEDLVGLRRSGFPESSGMVLGNVSRKGDNASRSITTREGIWAA